MVVSTAAGGVGSCAGQIAKIIGCRTVGIAGGKIKTDLCLNEFKYDAAIDHLTKAAPVFEDPALLAESRLWIGRSHLDAGRAKEAVPMLQSAQEACGSAGYSLVLLWDRDPSEEGGGTGHLHRVAGGEANRVEIIDPGTLEALP